MLTRERHGMPEAVPQLTHLQAYDVGMAWLEGRPLVATPLSEWEKCGPPLDRVASASLLEEAELGLRWLLRAVDAPEDLLDGSAANDARPHESASPIRPSASSDVDISAPTDPPEQSAPPTPYDRTSPQRMFCAIEELLRGPTCGHQAPDEADSMSDATSIEVAHSQRRLTLPNGNIYESETIPHAANAGLSLLFSSLPIPHGRGRMTYSHSHGAGVPDISFPQDRSPRIFLGDWKNCEWSGYGAVLYCGRPRSASADSSADALYLGQLRRGEPHGNGIFLARRMIADLQTRTERDFICAFMAQFHFGTVSGPIDMVSLHRPLSVMISGEGQLGNAPSVDATMGTTPNSKPSEIASNTTAAGSGDLKRGTTDHLGDVQTKRARIDGVLTSGKAFITTLRTDEWHCVLAFLDLGALHTLLPVCREIQDVICRVPCLHLGYSRGIPHYTGDYHQKPQRTMDFVPNLIEFLSRTRLARHVSKLQLDQQGSNMSLSREQMQLLHDRWPHLELVESCIDAGYIEGVVSGSIARHERADDAHSEEDKVIFAASDADNVSVVAPADQTSSGDVTEVQRPSSHAWRVEDIDSDQPEPLPGGINEAEEVASTILPWPRPAALRIVRLMWTHPIFERPDAAGLHIGLALQAIFPAPLELAICTTVNEEGNTWMQSAVHMLPRLPHLTSYEYQSIFWTPVRRIFPRVICRLLPRLRLLRMTNNALEPILQHLQHSNAQPLQHFDFSSCFQEDYDGLLQWAPTLRVLSVPFHSSLIDALKQLPLLEEFHLIYDSRSTLDQIYADPSLIDSLTYAKHLHRLEMSRTLTVSTAQLATLLRTLPLRTLDIGMDHANFSLAAFADPSSLQTLSTTLRELLLTYHMPMPRFDPEHMFPDPFAHAPHLFGLRALRKLVCRFNFPSDWYPPAPQDFAPIPPSIAEGSIDHLRHSMQRFGAWRDWVKELHVCRRRRISCVCTFRSWRKCGSAKTDGLLVMASDRETTYNERNIAGCTAKLRKSRKEESGHE